MYHWHSSPGGGAVSGRDGLPVTGPLPTLGGLTLPNVETYEHFYPCRVHRQELRCDAGGAGEFRGGPSVAYEAEMLVPSVHAMRHEGLMRPSGFGAVGGAMGDKGMMLIKEGDAPPRAAPQYAVEQMTQPMRLWTHGCAGGGWGDPLRRDPERVLRDVRDGIVSREMAQQVYGVLLSGDGRSVDAEATRDSRQRLGGTAVSED